MSQAQSPSPVGKTAYLVPPGTDDEFSPGDTAPQAPIPEDVLQMTITDALVGQVLCERYEILDKLGEGGMGTVYLAEHVTIRKRCAIKVLSQEYANKQDLIDRFLQEARAASMISHENVVEITDFGTAPNGSVFFVMEWLDGEDLSSTIKREGALPWSRVQPIALQICRALEAAHGKGIIHRDMKPENCFRIKRSSSADFIKVLDFGIAKVTTEEGDGKGLTKTGMIFGTPEYMSPEQAQGIRVDHRADIYAVGVILYELLTGKVPFTADSFMGILTQHMFEAPKSPRAMVGSITEDVENIILKSMQKDRDLRFQSMSEFIEAIEAVGTGAAPVAVVAETLSKPPERGKAMTFTGEAAPANQTVPQLATATLPPTNTGGNKITLIVSVVAALIVGIGGALMFLSTQQEKEEAPVEVAKAPEPEPEPEPAKVEPEPAAKADLPAEDTKAEPAVPMVSVTISANVTASIIDPSDGGVLGETGTPIELPKSEEKRPLSLQADGYKDLDIEITPNAKNKTFKFKLKKAPKGEGKKKKKKVGKTKKPDDKKSGDTGGGSVVPSSELKNPFNRRPK